MGQPLVSVIVPVYNVEPYLESCLNSIVDQTYKNLQIILIDDGSADHSGEICDAYARKDARVEVIHNTNHGVSYSRNCGLDAAKGEYVTFVDSDDTIERECVEALATAFGVKACDLAIGGIAEIFGEYIKKRRCKGTLEGDFVHDYSALLPFLLLSGSKMYRKDIIKENRLRFEENISHSEDQIFNFSYYVFVKTYHFVNRPLYNYFHRENHSLSQKYTRKNFEGVLYKFQKEIEFYERRKIYKKDEIICNQCVFDLERFLVLEDSTHQYRDFKGRAKQFERILRPYYVYTTMKRRILFYALQRHVFLPVYMYYCLKRFVKPRFETCK